MRQQRGATVGIEPQQRVPQIVFALGQLRGPVPVTGFDRLGGSAVGKTRRLRAEARALRRNLQAGVECEPVERAEAQRVQHRRKRRAGIVRERIAQRQRAVRRQFDDQPLRQRLDAIVVLRIALRLGGCVTADDTDDDPWAALRLDSVRSIAGDGSGSRFRAAIGRRDRRFVLAPDIAALDPQSAVGVDADEHASAGDLGGVISDRPVIERRQRRLRFRQAGRPPRPATPRRRRILVRGRHARPAARRRPRVPLR